MNILAATANDKAKNHVYNCAVGDRTTPNDLYQAIKKALENQQINVTPAQPEYCDFSAGEVRHSQADVCKAQALLGYEPSHNISQGLEEAMPWYKRFLG